MNDTVISLKFYLEGLQRQILHHVENIEELHACRKEMKRAREMSDEMEQEGVEYKILRRKSKMNPSKPYKLRRKKTA